MIKTFDYEPEKGDFSAYDAAVQWCKDQGFSAGSMQRGAPTLVYAGDCYVAKYRNLSPAERRSAIGRIEGVGGRFRECQITITIKFLPLWIQDVKWMKQAIADILRENKTE